MDPKNTGPKKDEIDYSDPQKIKDLQQKIADIKKESSNVVQQSSSFFSNSNKNKVTLDPRLKELQEQLIKEVTKPRRPKNDGKYNAADPPTVDGEHYKGNNDITSNTSP
jgi:hypothetical protein